MIPDIPDSDSAQAAADLAAEVCEPFLLNHSYRTFLFGRILVPSDDIDIEAAFIASMIHDLGLTDRFVSDASFELTSADVAAHFLEARGWDTIRIKLVEDAIVEHTNIEPNTVPELIIVQAGAALDVVGAKIRAISQDDMAGILAAFPRLNFVEDMGAAFTAEIERQPSGVFAELQSALDFSSLIPANPLNQA